MPFLSYERLLLAGGGVVHTGAALTFPSPCQRVMIQADGGDIRYTLDGSNPNGVPGRGMILYNGEAPVWFEREDLVNFRFCRSVPATATYLNVHYYAPRDV